METQIGAPMFKADFALLRFEGGETETSRVFFVDRSRLAPPRGKTGSGQDGFVLLRVLTGDPRLHKGAPGSDLALELNGRSLPDFDLAPPTSCQVWIGRLPPGFLKKGENRFTLHQRGGLPIASADLIVQWRGGPA